VSAIGWGKLLSAANPIAIAAFALMHLHIIIRAAMLVVLEFILALIDSIRGFIDGKNLLDEIKYIPVRVMACVILREITGVGAKIDITRGMPVIHINLAGYDEQAHHRGPKSGFAHWSLRAIDSVIKTVWKTAKRSPVRDYEVFIYSDHGQEETTDYREEFGRPVQEAINEVLKEERLIAEFESSGDYGRADMMRNRPVKKITAVMEERNRHGPRAVITALGPVGHIYPSKKLNIRQKERIARMLIAFAKIPLVLVSAGRKNTIAWNAEGRFVLPRDAGSVLGEEHPFLKETAKDLVELCRNRSAGEIIISGLRKQGRSITFYNERGSHGGPGPHETSGFALMPPGMAGQGNKTINTGEIRNAVFEVLKRGNKGRTGILMPEAGPNGQIPLKIMSYNVHACRGRDGRVRPERIARVIAGHHADIVALQEIDVSHDVHQAKVIADMLSMKFYYHSSVALETGLHGNAILSKFDMKLVRRGSLPGLMNTPFLEKRGALWVEINAAGRKVQVINTHLSLFPLEGMLQAKNLLGRDWLGSPDCKGPVILCGDFNSLVNSRICKAVGKDLKSVYFHEPDYRRLKTFPSFFPLGLVDHIFLGKGIKAVKTEIPKTHLEKTASDHLPLIAEVMIENPNKQIKRRVSTK
jgi:endonuclease/exonuclease/phosphatase family metal-dependent hydrolase